MIKIQIKPVVKYASLCRNAHEIVSSAQMNDCCSFVSNAKIYPQKKLSGLKKSDQVSIGGVQYSCVEEYFRNFTRKNVQNTPYY